MKLLCLKRLGLTLNQNTLRYKLKFLNYIFVAIFKQNIKVMIIWLLVYLLRKQELYSKF